MGRYLLSGDSRLDRRPSAYPDEGRFGNNRRAEDYSPDQTLGGDPSGRPDHRANLKRFGAIAAATVAGVAGWVIGNRGEDSVGAVPPRATSSSSSTYSGASSSPETPVESPEKPVQPDYNDLNTVAFPGFVDAPDVDPASGESVTGIQALEQQMVFTHPPFGDQDPLAIKLDVAGGLFHRLGFYASAIIKDPQDIDPSAPDGDFLERRNNALIKLSQDTLFNRSGLKSPFGQAVTELLKSNASFIEHNKPASAITYEDIVAAAAVGEGELLRVGGNDAIVQQYVMDVGLPGGRFNVTLTGREDPNTGEFTWEVTDSKALTD